MATILNILSNLSNIHVAMARLVCLYCTVGIRINVSASAAGLTNSPPQKKLKNLSLTSLGYTYNVVGIG